jgi:hypothetical protein
MDVAQVWRTSFMETVHQHEHRTALSRAALLGEWTKAMTSAVTQSCQSIGWQASAKGHTLKLQPIEHGEYLALDVTAFRAGKGRWHFPIAVFELENGDENRIAYSLWKVLCVQTTLRIVICYRQFSSDIPGLVQFLHQDIIAPMDTSERQHITGETLLVIGGRDAIDQFPSGFFKWWRLNISLGQFELFR